MRCIQIDEIGRAEERRRERRIDAELPQVYVNEAVGAAEHVWNVCQIGAGEDPG